MYAIQKEPYGYRLTFSGYIPMEEMQQWLDDCKKELLIAPKEFTVFVDMRDLAPLEPEAQKRMVAGQTLFKDFGMIRSVVVVDKPVVNLQFLKIAKITGIYENERYLDEMTSPNWEEVGLDWIMNGIEPVV